MTDRAAGVVPREIATAGTGLAFLRAMIAGEHPAPPFAGVTDIWLTEAAEGRVLFEGRPSASFLNPLGTVHGGWTATILDSAMGCAVHSTLRPGEGFTTLELKVNLVRAVLPTAGTLRCEGRLLHRGGTVATAEGDLRDAAGRLLAHGTTTCLVMDAGRGRGS